MNDQTNDEVNPYAAPTSRLSESEEMAEPYVVVSAGKGARLLNFIIDYFAQFAISFVVGMIIVIFAGEEGLDFIENTPDIVFGIVILVAYYFFFEATTSRTLGKLITGTKVVNADGQKPSLGQIAGRSFSRLIPFEALSFLGTSARGWHDSLPNTYVVKSR